MKPEMESGDILARELVSDEIDADNGKDETDMSNPSKGSCSFLVYGDCVVVD